MNALRVKHWRMPSPKNSATGSYPALPGPPVITAAMFSTVGTPAPFAMLGLLPVPSRVVSS